MARRILSYLLLTLVIAWLVLSYAATSIVSLPQVSTSENSAWFGQAALLILVIMAVIQVGLLGATARFVRAYHDRNQGNVARRDILLHLKLNAELFWTFVPLLIVFILGLLSFSIWGSAWL